MIYFNFIILFLLFKKKKNTDEVKTSFFVEILLKNIFNHIKYVPSHGEFKMWVFSFIQIFKYCNCDKKVLIVYYYRRWFAKLENF